MSLYSPLEKGNSTNRNYVVIGFVSEKKVRMILEMVIEPDLLERESLHFVELDDNPNRFEIRVRYEFCPPVQERLMRWIYFIKGLNRGWTHFRPKTENVPV